jgi:hypothetical protein
VVRLFVLVALCGCDVLFQLDEIVPIPAVCGPYRSVTPVPITGVGEPSGFSTIADSSTAMVTGLDAMNVRRPIALEFDGTQWVPHPSLQTGLGAFEGAVLAPIEPAPLFDRYTGLPAPVILAWAGFPDVLGRYYFDNGTWTQDANQPGISDFDYEIRAGNVVLVAGNDSQDRVRHTVVVKIAKEVGAPNVLQITANNPLTPNPFSLVPKPDRTRPLDDQMLAITGAVLSDSQGKLVYAATGASSDLYASGHDAQRAFHPGGYIDGVNTPDDEVEPWIDGTCSKLYFRRIPRGQAGVDPGTIFVAE